ITADIPRGPQGAAKPSAPRPAAPAPTAKTEPEPPPAATTPAAPSTPSNLPAKPIARDELFEKLDGQINWLRHLSPNHAQQDDYYQLTTNTRELLGKYRDRGVSTADFEKALQEIHGARETFRSDSLSETKREALDKMLKSQPITEFVLDRNVVQSNNTIEKIS